MGAIRRNLGADGRWAWALTCPPKRLEVFYLCSYIPSLNLLRKYLMICPQHNHLIFLGSYAGCMKAEHLSYCQGWTLGNSSLQAWVIWLEQVLRNETHRLWREQRYFRVGGEIKAVSPN